MSLFLFVVVLAVLVLSHEFGHFIIAKFFGIRVDEFGFGFPPKLYGIKKGETEYTFNLIPFGGFVKIYGEDTSEELLSGKDKDSKRALTGKPKLVQAAVLVGGVFFNFLLAWFLISTGITIGAPVSVSALPERLIVNDVKLTITNVFPDTPADKAGLKSGDNIIFLSTDEQALQDSDLTVDRVKDFIATHGDKKIFLGYKRGEEINTVEVVPIKGILEEKTAIGVSLDMVGVLKLPFYRSALEGFVITARLTRDMVFGLTEFIFGFFTGESSLKSVSGPIGIIGIVGDASKMGLVYLLNIIAIISINLAVLNMMPFPALDGGRLMFLFFEYLKGSPISPKVFNAVNIIGFIVLMSFMLVVTYGDVVKIFFS